jgi:hypothetical protein
MSKLASSTILFVVQVTDTSPGQSATFTKVGKGIKVTASRPMSKAQEKANTAAEAAAKANPGSRFYVLAMVGGFMKRPEVCSRSYKTA